MLQLTYDNLLQTNRQTTFAKLDNCSKVTDQETWYVTDDIIDALSSNVTYDKRLINDFPDDEMQIKYVEKATRRLRRCFSQKGILHYLQIGHVYSYKNACEYFKVPPTDKEMTKLTKKINTMVVNGRYNIRRVLKFLYSKRKQNKSWGTELTAGELLPLLHQLDEDRANHEDLDCCKLTVLIKHCNDNLPTNNC